MNYLKIKTENTNFYSPYSGTCIYGEEQEMDIEKDKTVLFSCFDESGWGYVSSRIEELLSDKITDINDFTPADIAKLADIQDSILIEYNAGWNGKTWFLFAPV